MEIKKQRETIVADPVISGLDADVETGREKTEKINPEKIEPKKKLSNEEIEKKLKAESEKTQTINNAESRTFIDKEDQY